MTFGVEGELPPNFHATMTRAASAATPTRPSSTARRSNPCSTGLRRARCADRAGASSKPSATKRESYSSTYSCPSRPRKSAYVRRKPFTYGSAGSASNCSSSIARRYFPRIFVASSTCAIVIPWRVRASRRLFPISNTRERL